MARSPATAAAILLAVLSLLAVAHCRSVAAAADHATEPDESTAAVAISDDNGLSNSNPTLPDEPGTSATKEVVLPAEQRRHGFLRLPSHRPCHLQRRIWLGRRHGVFLDLEAPPARRFQFFRLSRHGESREAVSVSNLAALAAEEANPVAEPDPDRSLPDSDGEGEPSFGDADGAHGDGAAHHHDDDGGAAVRAWKEEMLRRWFHFHHGMRRHRIHHVHHDVDEEEEAAPEGMKRFHFHHHHHDKEKEENMMRKRLRHAEAEHEQDSDNEDEEVEEMVRRFRKAIMKSRRKFGHGRRFHRHHHHSHRDAEEAAEKKADGEEEGGVMAWIKGLMNHF